MRFAGRFILGLALGLGLAAVFPAAAGTAAGQPYATIVSRNIFGLLPIPVVDPATLQPPADPPPKITPNGIMSIFGRLQVLFKVAVKPPPGQPAKDASYVMGEGERQDEIEVMKIDEKAGVVTFDNHGTVQELPLVAVSASGPGGPGISPGGPGGRTPFNPNRGAGGGFGSVPMPGGGANPGAGGASPAGSAPMSGGVNSVGIYQPPETQLSPEAQVIMMEAQRAKWQEEGNPAAALFPPTPLTQQNTPPPPGQK